jgi:hypothetical protein
MKNLICLVFVALFIVSCEPDFKSDFIEMSCDMYEQCDFSKVERPECEKFTDAMYENNTPENPEKCMNCLKSIECDMWTHGELCEDFCHAL